MGTVLLRRRHFTEGQNNENRTDGFNNAVHDLPILPPSSQDTAHGRASARAALHDSRLPNAGPCNSCHRSTPSRTYRRGGCSVRPNRLNFVPAARCCGVRSSLWDESSIDIVIRPTPLFSFGSYLNVNGCFLHSARKSAHRYATPAGASELIGPRIGSRCVSALRSPAPCVCGIGVPLSASLSRPFDVLRVE